MQIINVLKFWHKHLKNYCLKLGQALEILKNISKFKGKLKKESLEKEHYRKN